MQNIKEKISYIYYATDGIYLFLANRGINDHSKRCVMRRFFILFDTYMEMIGFLKNDLFRKSAITLDTKQTLESEIKEIRLEWENNYQIIRNKLSAHHQNLEDVELFEWWNEIDYSTITFFYEGMRKIRSILSGEANFKTLTPVDYEEIDFSDTCLAEQGDSNYYLAHDRLGLSKKNTVGMLPLNEFQQKCMLILSVVDFIFINCAITTKTQNYKTYYKNILFDSAWLLLACDTVSLLENLYENNAYSPSLLSIAPSDWLGKSILENSKLMRDELFEIKLKLLRNKFAAHLDTGEQLKIIMNIFETFDLNKLHEYCMFHMRSFQLACLSDIRTKMFAFRDQKLSGDILGISYSEHESIES